MKNKPQSEYQELRARLESATSIFGERVMGLDRSVTKHCDTCFDKTTPKVVVPTYFFYKWPHHKVEKAAAPQRQVGFNMVMK